MFHFLLFLVKEYVVLAPRFLSLSNFTYNDTYFFILIENKYLAFVLGWWDFNEIEN